MTENPESFESLRRVTAELNRLRTLANSQATMVEFYRQLVEIVRQACQAHAGYIWIQVQNQNRLLTSSPLLGRSEFELLEKEIQTKLEIPARGQASTSEVLDSNDVRAKSTSNSFATNSLENELHATTYLLGGNSDTSVVLSLIHDSSEEFGSVFQQEFIDSIKDVVREYHRNIELNKLRVDAVLNRQLFELSQRFLTCSSQRELDIELVNSTANLLQIDRVSKVTGSDSEYVVDAVSGVSSINRGAQSLKTIIEKVQQNLQSNGSNQSPTPDEELQFAVQQISGSGEGQPAEYLLLEWEQPIDYAEKKKPTLDLICRLYASVATKTNHGQTFAKSLSSRKLRWVGGIAVVFVLCMWLIPANLKIRASGSIHPKIERGVYAPFDGQIVKVKAFHDKEVKKGDVLLEMRSVDLEFKLSELRGEERATKEKIRAIEASYSKGDEDDRENQQNIELASASTIKELKIIQASQAEQIGILESQKELLKIRSPINGRIVTWQIKQLLEDRQVKRGQLLLSVADTNSDWIAKLEIRDHRAGHVLDRLSTGNSPDLEFLCISNPETTFHGKLTRIEQNTVEDFSGNPVVKASGNFDKTESDAVRSGTQILARINCGRRSLGYVWFHEFYESAVGYLF